MPYYVVCSHPGTIVEEKVRDLSGRVHGTLRSDPRIVYKAADDDAARRMADATQNAGDRGSDGHVPCWRLDEDGNPSPITQTARGRFPGRVKLPSGAA
jgi:hypothetical protein